MNASDAVRNAAADFDKFLHDTNQNRASTNFLDPADALARLEQVRRGGHNPAAIAQNVRNLNRTETAVKSSADQS
jgi:hypothetical protein